MSLLSLTITVSFLREKNTKHIQNVMSVCKDKQQTKFKSLVFMYKPKKSDYLWLVVLDVRRRKMNQSGFEAGTKRRILRASESHLVLADWLRDFGRPRHDCLRESILLK